MFAWTRGVHLMSAALFCRYRVKGWFQCDRIASGQPHYRRKASTFVDGELLKKKGATVVVELEEIEQA